MPEAERPDAPTPFEALVVLVRSRGAHYGALERPLPAPELPAGEVRTVPEAALRELFLLWGLDREHAGQPGWNPLGAWCPPGARIVLKPNWVLHYNQAGQGLDCLLTHPGIIEAVARYVALTRPARLVIGDAPVQGCDFAALRAACGLQNMTARLQALGLPVEVVDFRRTILDASHLGAHRRESVRQLEDFVLFDLKQDSLLEGLASQSDRFRVTMYNPDLLARTHAPGRHQYLIAREVLAADVVINLPKLKTHRKACLTGALKNLVGINGNKEYLPHHRKGGQGAGGDCYPGRSWWKSRAEDLLDAAHRRAPGRAQSLLASSAGVLCRLAGLLGADDNLEGAWYGNDTVWRTCLDLQRILRYGRGDGAMSPTPQRQVVTVTDAIIGGDGEGPLANGPVPSAFLSGGLNPAAVEWAHARLMGFNPARIPLVREAFGQFPYPLVSFPASTVVVRTADGEIPVQGLHPFSDCTFRPPAGWAGHCELAGKVTGHGAPP